MCLLSEAMIITWGCVRYTRMFQSLYPCIWVLSTKEALHFYWFQHIAIIIRLKSLHTIIIQCVLLNVVVYHIKEIKIFHVHVHTNKNIFRQLRWVSKAVFPAVCSESRSKYIIYHSTKLCEQRVLRKRMRTGDDFRRMVNWSLRVGGGVLCRTDLFKKNNDIQFKEHKSMIFSYNEKHTFYK